MKILERLRAKLFGPKFKQPLVFPPITPYMKDKGLVWARVGETDDFIMVCNFCYGNCGQCGLTSIVGNVGFDIGVMAYQAGITKTFEPHRIK